MAEAVMQKMRILHLCRFLMRETDEFHGVGMAQILSYLESHMIYTERKTIYGDMESLRKFGIDVKGVWGPGGYVYHVVSRPIELADLNLLADAVQAAKFITEAKSQELINKLRSLCSSFEGDQLSGEAHLGGGVKAMNKTMYSSIDKIHAAINTDSQIWFLYFRWNERKEPELQDSRDNGKWYTVSPWCLICDDSYYYLVAYDEDCESVKHYRVDKMLDVELLKKKRHGGALFSGIDEIAFSKSAFAMCVGEDVSVTLEVENQYADVLIDRFGRDIMLERVDDDHFRTAVNVVPNNLFLSWVMSFGDGIRVVGPEDVLEAVRRMITVLQKTYL